MNKQEARSLFMDYIYDELDEKQKNELEAFLTEHPALRDELHELQETRTMIGNIPMEEPAHKLIVVKPETGRFLEWYRNAREVLLPETALARMALAMAAVLLLTLLVGSLARVQVTSSGEGWAITFGAEPAVIEQGVDTETLNEIIELMRQENLLLASTLMEETQQQNEAQLSEAVTAILGYMEEQRRRDLQLVGRGLAEIEEENYYRYLQTNETLGELLYVINQQP